MGAKIIHRGRGPEIVGTRITVYDVLDYLQAGWRYDQIAGLLSRRQTADRKNRHLAKKGKSS